MVCISSLSVYQLLPTPAHPNNLLNHGRDTDEFNISAEVRYEAQQSVSGNATAGYVSLTMRRLGRCP